jgi:acetyltransferase-like isoleucine patch superfamily enzyme
MSEQYEYSLLKSVGEDVFISRNVEIRRPHLVTIGNHIAIDTGFYCTTEATIKDYVHIGPYVTVIGGAKALFVLKGFNSVGAGCRILCASDEFLGAGLVGISPSEYRDNVIFQPVVFEMFASAGTNVVIHPGVTLAEGSVVGSCSLVTKDTEPWTIYYGIPAKPVKQRRKDKMLASAKAMGYSLGEKNE